MSSPIVLDYGDYIIRESDFKLVESERDWLNDNIIGFYLQYLWDEGQKGDVEENKYQVVGPAVTQMLKLIEEDNVASYLFELVVDLQKYQYTFFAVNDSSDPEAHSGGSHWSLLIYSKIDKKFVHFDSYCKSNAKDAKIIAKKLKKFTDDAEVTGGKCKGQVNSYDCGCHVLRNAELIMEYIRSNKDVSLLKGECPSCSPTDAGGMRPKLVTLIMELAKAK